MPTTADRYRRWFEYERDAHDKVVRSLETVPADRRASPEYRRALGLLGHLAAARLIWLHRLGLTPDRPTAFFPENVELADVAASLRDVQDRWTAYYAGLTDAEIDRAFEYQAIDGKRFRNRIEDILTQLYGHSLYHRGQVALLVRQAGGEPAATDFVYWCREAVT
jgi:uncharacterized damage-inducible protein DinB